MAGFKHKMNVSRYEREPNDENFRTPIPAHYLKLRALTDDLVLFDDYIRPWTADDQAELDRVAAA